MTGRPWQRAVIDAADDRPASAEAAVRDELSALWHDLDVAIGQTIRGRFTPPGAWSMHSIGIAERIIYMSRLVGATPWECVPYTRLLDGTYQGMMADSGIEHGEPGEVDLQSMRDWREGRRLKAWSRSSSRT